MSSIVLYTLHCLGAIDIQNAPYVHPITEEQFKTIQFKSLTPITWDIYINAEKNAIPRLQEKQKKGAKELCKHTCLRALKESEYIIADPYLENIEEWITYRNLLTTLPDSIDYDSLRIDETQFDFKKCMAPPPPPVKKK